MRIYRTNNAAVENITEQIITVNSVKHRWHETINNTTCYYQMNFNIAFVLEQLSSHNSIICE